MRHIGAAEAIELLETGKATGYIWEHRILRIPRQDQLVVLLAMRDPGLKIVLRLKAPERADVPGPASISYSEVEINGLSQSNLAVTGWVSQKRARDVRDKVAAWPFIGDDRAIRVRPIIPEIDYAEEVL